MAKLFDPKMQFKRNDLHRFLDILNEEGHDAVIAGGMPRDIILGGNPRDIDLYVNANSFQAIYWYVTTGAWPEEGSDLGKVWRDDAFIQHEQGSEAYVHQSIQWQVEIPWHYSHQDTYPNLMPHPVNIIAVKDALADDGEERVRNVINRFNLSISQIGMTMNTGDLFIFTEQFMNGASGDPQHCTILRDHWGQEGTAANIDRIWAKYPNIAVFHQDGTLYDKEKFLAGETYWKPEDPIDALGLR